MRQWKRFISLFLCLVITVSFLSQLFTAQAYSILDLIGDSISDWIDGFSGNNTGAWVPVDPLSGVLLGVNPSSGSSVASSSQPRNYYTTCTSSTQDQYGNVTNY